MEDLLISTLESALGYDVRLQGSLLPDESYPDHFFTYWNRTADGAAFYDNDESAVLWVYDLNFYSIDADAVYTKLMEAKALLKAAGFIVTGAGYSVMSDEPTHTGRGISVLYSQRV